MRSFISILLVILIVCPETGFAASAKKEVKKGKEDHQKIIATFGVYGDPELQAYVNRIGQKIAAKSSRPELTWTFTLLNDDLINAFATRGGFVYVTRGLLAQLNSEAELASVLGHEIAHITERHLNKAENTGKLMEALTVVAAVFTQMPGLYELGNLYGGVLLRGYNREQELEADRLGIETMTKAGYRADALFGVIEMFRARDRQEYREANLEKREPQVYHGFLSTHPDNESRTRQIIKELKDADGSGNNTDENDQYLTKLNGLAFGKTQKVGVVRRNRFYYPKLGIKMTFPFGWRFEAKTRGGVEMVSAPADAAVNFTSGRIKKGISPKDYLEKKRGLQLREGRDVTIGPFPGYIGIADRANSRFGPRPVRVAVLFDKRKRRAYILEGSGKHDLRKIANDKEFIATIFSFNKMSKQDFSVAKVPTLQVVRAEQGVTMEDLADESPITNYPLEKLRIMNGLYPDGEPEPGQLIKIVQ